MNTGAVKANCCTSPLFSFRSLKTSIFSPSFSTSPSALNMEELICSFCKQHLILFIFLLVFFPPLSLRQGCAVRPFQSSGVVRSDGWLSTFCCLPLRSWEIYRLADYQAWKPISLSHSSLPSSIHACLAPSVSHPAFQHLVRYPKKIFGNGEMCAKQHRNLCADAGKRLLLLRVIVDVSEGNSMFRMIRLVFDSLSCPSSSSSSPLLPAPSRTYNTYIHPHSSCC